MKFGRDAISTKNPYTSWIKDEFDWVSSSEVEVKTGTWYIIARVYI